MLEQLMDALRLKVLAANLSIKNLDAEDRDVRMDAVLDFAELLTAARNVVQLYDESHPLKGI